MSTFQVRSFGSNHGKGLSQLIEWVRVPILAESYCKSSCNIILFSKLEVKT